MTATTIQTVWELWSYDVWGNAADGYDVNDRNCFDRAYELELVVETHNVGTPHEFRSAHPTDAQVKEAFGVKCRIETDGDDAHVYVTRERDGYPIGEMLLVSPESGLSPIK